MHLVYHKDSIKSYLEDSHPIFNTPLFTMAGLFEEIKPSISCRIPRPTDDLLETGVPAHVFYLAEMMEISKCISEVLQKVPDGVTEILEERAIDSGTITRAGLKDMKENRNKIYPCQRSCEKEPNEKITRA